MKRKILLIVMSVLMLCSCGRNAQSDGEPAKTSVPSDSTPSESQGITEPQTDAEEKRVSFVGCGDNIVYYGNVREAAYSAANGRSYDFRPTYAGVEDTVRDADIAMINQETVMAAEFDFSYYPRFNGPVEMGQNLCELGFDVISIANNHMLDKDSAGLVSTIDYLKSLGITLIGGYKSEEEYNALNIVEKNGIKIAFLAYTYGTNGIKPDGEYPVVIPLFDEAVVRRQIKAARESADFVIVSAHWGTEDSFTPTDEQRSYARIMAEAGADVIVGHHPHVLQPIEWLYPDSGGRTLCVYSLGNFCAEQAYDRNMLGGMIKLDIVKQGDTVKTENAVFLPTVYYFNKSFYGNYIYPFNEFTDVLAASHGISNYENTISVQSLTGYLKNTISEEFLK